MTTSILTQKGQTTIPKFVREHLGIKPNGRIVYVPQLDGKVYMVRVNGNVLDAAGAFKKKGRKPIDFQRMREDTKETVTRRIKKELE